MKANPHILILKSHLSKRGGLEKATLRLAQGFAIKGSPVTILTGKKSACVHENPLIEMRSVGVHSFFASKRLSLFDRKSKKFASRVKPDVIFGMDRTSSQTHLRAGNGCHKAYLERRSFAESALKRLSFKLNPLHRAILVLEKRAVENPDLHMLFTNSNMVRKEMLRFYSIESEKVCVIPNGVEWNEMEKPFNSWIEKKPGLAQSYCLDPSDFHFLFVGNDYRRKGLQELLEALAGLPLRDFHLSVLGKDKNVKSWKAMVKKLGLESKVTFFGTVKDVTPFYQFSDCLVIPSRYDPFANVTVEALAMGLFVISSPFNGGSEVIEDGNGLVLPSLTNREAFIEALAKAMNQPKTWNRSQSIRQSVKHLDFSNTLKQYIDKTLATC